LSARALALALALAALDCRASEGCAATLDGLRAILAQPDFPLRWRETSMTDGRPLVLSVLERNGALVLEFVKTGESLWADGDFVVCRQGGGLQARAGAHQMRLGPAASWLTRLALSRGGTFTLARTRSGGLAVATSGWDGLFVVDRDGSP
jgi:hypothetical protein